MEAAPSSKLTPRTIVWVERLDAASLIGLLIRASRIEIEVRFDEHAVSPLASAGLRLLSRTRWGRSFLPAGLTLALKDADGGALTYRKERIQEEALAAFCETLAPSDAPSFRRMLKCHLSDQLGPRTAFIVMVEAAAAALRSCRHELLLVSHPANAPLLAHPDLQAIRSRGSLSFRAQVRSLGVPLALLVRLLARALRNAPPMPPHPAIWVEYYPDDVDGYVSRAFWRDHIDAKKVDKVFYIDRRDTSSDRATIDRIERAGFGWIDCKKPWRLSHPSLGSILEALSKAARRLTTEPLWLTLFRCESDLLAAMWAGVFGPRRVRLLIQHQEASWRQAAQAVGLSAAGGRMVGFHWSDYRTPVEAALLYPQHVFFTWGANHFRWLRDHGNDCTRILPCGAWIVPERNEIARLKAQVEPSDFTLALFDSSFAYNIFISAQHVARFLDAGIRLLEENRSWRGILKPKSLAQYDKLPGGPALMTRIRALEADGRIVCLDRRVAPVNAALAANLSLCIDMNSAGVLAGVFGARAIHWDCAGWNQHPLYRIPDQSLLFADLTNLIDVARRAAAGNRAVGDFERWQKLVNHFNDTKAPSRVGGWMMDFIERTEAGEAPAVALASSADEYLMRHGVDSSFYDDAHWWGAQSGICYNTENK